MSIDWTKKVAAPTEAERLAAARAEAKVALSRWIDALADGLQEHAPQVERDSYPQQEAAARAHVGGTPSAADTALLAALAAQRGRTVEQTCARIIAKADAYRGLIALIAGARGAAFDAIDAATAEAGIGAAVEAAKAGIVGALGA